MAGRLAADGESFVLATVVRREAPTSAQLGDTALITRDGEFHGWLGGACTKDLIVREAAAALARGAPRLVVLTADPNAERRNGLRVLPMTCHSGGTVEVYLDPQLPEEPLLVIGASEVADALARMAPELGFRVRRAATGAADAPEADAAANAGVPGAPYVVIATYGESDESALRRALALEPPYVGLVAGRKRFEALREALEAAGVDGETLDRVSSPAGLDIGARTPAEIAVSILAEMIDVRRMRTDGARAARTGREAGTPDGTAIDPVCGMTVSHDTPLRVEFEGATFFFCCDACRQRFLATPEMFSSSYAG